MKKVLAFLIIGILISTLAFAADVVFSYRIPESKVTTALEGFLKIYPNSETMDDPEWVDPEDGSKAPKIPKYTDKQWVVEKIRRIIVRDVRRGLQMLANENAIVPVDDETVTAE